MSVNKQMLAGAVALALSVPGMALSAALTIDADGTGGAASFTGGVTGLDWSPSNIMADGANLAVQNFVSGTGSTSFNVYGQGTLASFQGMATQPTTLNTVGGFTWTYVFGFGETVTSVSAPAPGGDPGSALATFKFDSTASTNFWEVYYTPTAGVDVYEGTGFNSGTLVFAGSFTGYTDASASIFSSGNFTIASLNDLPAVQNFDQTADGSTGDWATSGTGGVAQQTVVGSGTNSDLFIDTMLATISYVNPDFIKEMIDSYTLQNVSQTLPFKASLDAGLGGNLDPSLRFVTAAGGGAPTLFGPAAIGDINGYPVIGTGGGGNSIQFQSDFNSAISGTAVPEPGTLALLGLGLFGLSVRAARRRI